EEPRTIESMLCAAIHDRIYSADGHTFDFANKACELLHYLGWDLAEQILPTLMPQLARARGMEESSAWREPIDLIALIQEAEAGLADWTTATHPPAIVDDGLINMLLGD